MITDLTQNERTELERLMAKARQGSIANKDFDINLLEGQLKETALYETLSGNGATIEVKRDYASSRTGNVAIELNCNGKPSGILATKADWWAIVLDGNRYNSEVVVMVKTNRLKRLMGEGAPKRIVNGGDGMRAQMVLLPVEQLLARLGGVTE
jgi:hypothetical protein